MKNWPLWLMAALAITTALDIIPLPRSIALWLIAGLAAWQALTHK